MANKGRAPRELTDRIKDRICREVALGKSLRRALKGKGMPSKAKVMETLQEDTLFSDQYARARRQGIELHIDSILDLADSATAANAQAVRLRVDTRKWLASKLVPKVYGDKIELGGELNLNAGRLDLENKPLSEWSQAEKMARMQRQVFTLALLGKELRDIWGLENLAEGYGYLADQTWKQALEVIEGRRPLTTPAGLLPAPAQPQNDTASAEPKEREINPRPQRDETAPHFPSRHEMGLK